MKLLTGMVRLALFRAEGFDAFEGSRAAFLNSLAPLLAFPIVGTAISLFAGEGSRAVQALLATLVALLAPAVISHALARAWGVEAAWLRYAVAFNWCQWAVPVAGIGLVILGGMALGLGVSQTMAAIGVMICLLAYGVALHLFLARRGLGLSRGRSVALMLTMNIGTGILFMGPRLLAAP